MHARFADSVPASSNSIDDIIMEPLETRITEFKQDSKNMAVLTDFIDNVLQKAEAEATQKQLEQEIKKSQQAKEKSRQSFAISDFKNGKVVNRARGFVVRLFDAICNCANSAAAAPTARFKLRGKREQSQVAGDATEDDIEVMSLNKNKQNNDKEKKTEVKIKGVTLNNDEPEVIEMLKD